MQTDEITKARLKEYYDSSDWYWVSFNFHRGEL